MIWKILIGFLVIIGVSVAVLSIYRASVNGLMTQIGLVESDFDTSVERTKLGEAITGLNSTLKCDLFTRLKGTMSFMLGGDEEQGKLAFALGESRINCGAALLSQGKAEEGTYEIVKGFGYLKQGFKFVGERVGVDRRVCSGLPTGSTISETVGEILDATNGKVYEIVWEEWQDVVEVREPVEQACLDQRNSTR